MHSGQQETIEDGVKERIVFFGTAVGQEQVDIARGEAGASLTRGAKQDFGVGREHPIQRRKIGRRGQQAQAGYSAEVARFGGSLKRLAHGHAAGRDLPGEHGRPRVPGSG